ncbi:MAG: hypothetical protein ACYC06_02260 [Ilumatobacteraceae bacterium]
MNPHPSPIELADLADDILDRDTANVVRAHVAQCAYCRLLFRNAAETAVDSTVHATMPMSTGAPWRSYQTLAPTVGQIWRLSWDDVSVLGVLGREPVDLRMAVRLVVAEDDLEPATDSILADLAGDNITVAVLRAAVWVQLSTLETCVGEIIGDLELPDELLELTNLSAWIETQLPPWADDHTLDIVDQIAIDLEQLAEADWTSVRGDTDATQFDTDRLLQAGIDGPRVIELSRGAMPAANEYRALRSAGADPDALAAVPSKVRAELDQPRYKIAILDHARLRRMTESQVRQELASQLRMPIAARTTNGAQISLADRLRKLLDE